MTDMERAFPAWHESIHDTSDQKKRRESALDRKLTPVRIDKKYPAPPIPLYIFFV